MILFKQQMLQDMWAGGTLESRPPAQHQVKGGKVEERINLSRSYICLAADTYVLHYGKVLGHVLCWSVSQ